MVEQFAAISGHSGAKSRLLGEQCFQFSIFCSNKDLDGTILNSVPHDQWVQYNSNTRVWYSSDNKIIPIFRKEISGVKPDLFYIVGLYDWNFNFKLLIHFQEIPKLISVRGMLHPGALSQKRFKKMLYLSLWKFLGFHKKFRFHVTDEKEKGYVKETFGNKVSVSVAGNFPFLHQQSTLPAKAPGSLKLVSIALISPMKNILLVLESLVSIRGANEGGQIQYDIYGPVKDAGYWESCKEVIKRIPPNVSVKYHGEIPPSEVGHVLSKHHIFILPSKSENYGHALVEALSVGLPVITSEATPWNGLKAAKAGINVNLYGARALQESMEFFVAMGDVEFKEWSKGASEYSLESVDIERTRGEYEEMFKHSSTGSENEF